MNVNYSIAKIEPLSTASLGCIEKKDTENISKID